MDFVLYPLDVQTCAVDFGSCMLIFFVFNLYYAHAHIHTRACVKKIQVYTDIPTY